MARLSCRRKIFLSLLSSVGCILVYVEYVSYFIQTFSWTDFTCPNGSDCTRLLFVADPQLGGEQDEPHWITRWDSDRYLRRTYVWALRHSAPEAVIFLGDLMDEGSRANNWEFQRYKDRFFSIFPPDTSLKTFYIPGDNDIGGENGDPILPVVVHRFHDTFNKSADLTVGPCRIIKVNPVVETMPEVDPAQVASDRHIRIAVSHFPLIGLSSGFSDKLVQQLQPHAVFSAHTHSSRLRRGAMTSNTPLVSLLPISIRRGDPNRASGDEEGWTTASDVVEISVPTCSYRMGTPLIGYGYAMIDSTRRELWYAVLWLPSRLHQLLLYLGLLGLVTFVVFILVCSFYCTRPLNSYSKLRSKILF